MQVFRRFIPSLIVFFVRVLALTLRYRVEDRSGITRGEPKTSVIFLFWHNRILLVPYLYSRFFPGRKGSALTSPSKDGEIIAGVLKRFGVGNVRGSSSRRGQAAMLELATLLESGKDIAITPDGPRGPKYHLHPGAVKLAQITGVPLIMMRIEYSRYWELKSWDAFQIPKPFSSVTVFFDPPYIVSRTADDAAFESERGRIEAALLSGSAIISFPSHNVSSEQNQHQTKTPV